MKKHSKNKLPSGSYRIQVYDHSEQVFENGLPVYVDGKPKLKKVYISVTGKSKDEATAAAAKVRMHRCITGSYADLTLREAIERYIDSSDRVLSPTTLHGYKGILDRAFPELMDQKLRNINTPMLREAVNREARRTRAGSGNPITAKTVSTEYGLVRAALRAYAPEINTSVPLPQIIKNRHVLTQPAEIFRIVRGTEIELPVLLAMWLSFTASEILGLYKSKSIDGDVISIVQVQVRVGRSDVTKDTAKTATRRRSHRIPPYIKRLIDLVPGDKLVELSEKALSNRFIRAIDRAGLPHMTFHDLRHVNASVMAMLQVPDKYAQERGGWSSDAVMKGVYMQTFSEARTAVDNTIDAYFEQEFGIMQESIPESDLVLIRECEHAIETLYQKGYGHLAEKFVSAHQSKPAAADFV